MFDELDDPNPPALGAEFRIRVRERVRARRRRRGAVVGAAGAAVLGAAGVAGLYTRALQPLGDVQRLDVAGTAHRAPVTGAPRTVLLVGTDGTGGGVVSNDHSTPSSVGGEGVDPVEHADSVLLVRVDPAATEVRMLSVPRDLEVTAADGTAVRLAELFATEGPDGLVRVVEQELGVSVDHLVIADLAGFRDAVDAIGGVEVQVAVPLRDRMSGLSIDAPGCVHLNGAQSLALVRARHLEQQIEGSWVPDPSGDLGRMQRTRAFVDAVSAGLRSPIPDPLTLREVVESVSGALAVDAAFDISSMVDLLQDGLSAQQVSAVALPTSSAALDSGAVVLRTTEDAPAVLEWLTGAAHPIGLPGEQSSSPSTRPADESLTDIPQVIGRCG